MVGNMGKSFLQPRIRKTQESKNSKMNQYNNTGCSDSVFLLCMQLFIQCHHINVAFLSKENEGGTVNLL